MTWRDSFRKNAGQPSAQLGQRFDAGGQFLPEQGNTVVCAVQPGSETEVALADLRTSLAALPHADCFAFTAMPSYHMTVFEGVVDTRRRAEVWPEGLDLTLPIDTMTTAMTERLDGFAPPDAFAMRVVEVTPFGLRVTGATPQDEALVRAWRDGLSRALSLRTPGHDSYGFHITLAYVMHWPPARSVALYAEAMHLLTAVFRARVPVLHLARPAFCRFADMNAFPPVLRF